MGTCAEEGVCADDKDVAILASFRRLSCDEFVAFAKESPKNPLCVEEGVGVETCECKC